MTEPVDLPRNEALRVVTIPGKGRGVVTIEPLRAGALLEIAPVIPLTDADRPTRGTILYDYPFLWDEPPYIEAIALGIVSMINHSEAPNAHFETDHASRTVRLTALRDIAPGEEITFDYGIPLWFDAR